MVITGGKLCFKHVIHKQTKQADFKGFGCFLLLRHRSSEINIGLLKGDLAWGV